MEEPRIPLSDPDISPQEMEAVLAVLRSPQLSAGPQVEAFEREFASWLGRAHAVAVSSGTLGLTIALRALGIGAGDQVIAPAYAWHQIAHAIAQVGATPVLADINYWSGTLAPEKAAAALDPCTRAILAGNTNGHPAAWQALRELAQAHGLVLIEDSTEAIGSRYQGRMVGSFGDLSLFDFSQPSALVCGEGGMVLTDDARLASELRYYRSRAPAQRAALAIGSRPPYQASMSELAAALGRTQLARVEGILERRKRVEGYYLRHIQTFEGIKPPYIAPDVDTVHWMSYVVHLGTRFTRTLRNQIVDDLATAGVDAAVYCNPLHQQFFYEQLGHRRGDLRNTERIADRAIALPFHAHLAEDEVEFIVQTAKDSSINVGAGTAIYL